MNCFHLHEKLFINKDCVIMVEQFVNTVYAFSCQYGDTNSISYTAENILGEPKNFPKYGDFSEAYAMRTYGQWWDKAPSRSIDYMPQNNPDVISHDYIDLAYYESVYPIRISIYENYNPGSVVRIWALDSDSTQWFQLWSGPPQIVSLQSRIFSPPLQPCLFKTKMIRLEFNHSRLDYYTELEAVMLIGTFELIIPKDKMFDKNLTKLLQHINNSLDKKDIHNLTPKHMNAKADFYRLKTSLQEYCELGNRYEIEQYRKSKKSKLIPKLNQIYHNIPSFKEGYDTMYRFLHEDFPEFVKNVHVSSNKSEESSYDNFLVLPNETILKILGYLDLKSLYHLCNTNKSFNNLARDSLLYKYLNLRPYWYSFNENALNSLTFRCKYLQKLDLSWCGNHGSLTSESIKNFLNQCGSLLTHLRLNCCEIVDDSVILEISLICKNLKELCLRNCRNIKKNGFLHLQKLQFLEILDLYRTSVETIDLCKILRKNPRIRHLNIAGVLERLNADEIVKELGKSCLGLESVDFWKASSLTAQGINALTNCKNLREIDFSWCASNTNNQNEQVCFYKLFSCCKYLEKIFLASFRGLVERDLKHLSLCKELKQLDLLGAICLTPDICQDILLDCQKLEMIDLSFCDLINNSKIDEWRNQFPNVAIKRSFIEP